MPRSIALLMLVLPILAAADDAPRFVDRANGFSLQPPAFEPIRKVNTSGPVVTFNGPPGDAIAPACNVSISNSGIPLAKYSELMRQMFKSRNIEFRSEETLTVSGKPALLWKYGDATTSSLALVVNASGRMFLVTCVSVASSFNRLEPVFRATIDSFVVND